MLQSWNVHCSGVAIPGKEAMEWFSVEFMGFGVGRALSRAKRPWKSNLQQHLLLSTAGEELGGKVINMADRRNACRKNKGWMRLRSKEKWKKKNWQEIASFYPNVEIASDALDVSFSYSLVYSLCTFLSEAVRQKKHQSGCSLVCYSVLMLPLHTGFLLPISLMLSLQKLLCFQKHLSA